jgi:hypothetical protein
LFENADDPSEFGLRASDPMVTIVAGAGVDPAGFPKQPEPPSPPVKIAVSRACCGPRGVAEVVEAFRAARRLGAPVELDLYGRLDPANPASIPETDLLRWSAEPGVRWHGLATPQTSDSTSA